MSQSAAIEVNDLRKTYREGWIRRRSFEALKGVSFDVRQGEIFGLLGPNGAGKTTLIKILLGIVRKTGGGAALLGRPAGDRRGRQAVGYLPENLRIPRYLNANTALELYGNLSGLSSREVARRRGELLELVGLADRAKDGVRKYSKGMLQRLGLAQSLLHNPQLVILDEPTDGLDPVARAQVRSLLAEIKQQGKTIFVNSHLLQEVELICDRVAILERGHLRYVGPVDEITSMAHRGGGEKRESLHIEFRLAGSEADLRAALGSDRSATVTPAGQDQFQVALQVDDQQQVDALIDALRRAGISLISLSRQRITLEAAFLDILAESASEAQVIE